MTEIKLLHGESCLIDNEDYKNLSKYSWRVDSTGYVIRSEGTGINYKKYLIHREIMKPDNDLFVDHINRNRLDNRKTNLRICTRQQNQGNRGKIKKASSQYKGVSWHKRQNNWVAKIKENGKWVNLGTYKTEAEAALAYNKEAISFFGEFALLNKIT